MQKTMEVLSVRDENNIMERDSSKRPPPSRGIPFHSSADIFDLSLGFLRSHEKSK